jgi:hypothetical protein
MVRYDSQRPEQSPTKAVGWLHAAASRSAATQGQSRMGRHGRAPSKRLHASVKQPEAPPPGPEQSIVAMDGMAVTLPQCSGSRPNFGGDADDGVRLGHKVCCHSWSIEPHLRGCMLQARSTATRARALRWTAGRFPSMLLVWEQNPIWWRRRRRPSEGPGATVKVCCRLASSRPTWW